MNFYSNSRYRHRLNQIVMRAVTTILFLTVTLLQVAATTRAQSVSLNYKNGDLLEILRDIRKQSGYLFWYDEDNLTGKNKVTVTVSLKGATVSRALDACLSGTTLSYEIIKDAVYIKRETKPVRDNRDVKRQRITGRITDINGAALPGVTVRVKGTETGTVTDGNGMYAIDAEPDAVLVFSFVGYKTFEIKVNRQERIDMTMVENEATLNETIVKGYYTTTRELNTGNVSTVKAEQIERQPVADPMAALISRVPGLNVQQTSGVNGRRFIVTLRGQNSLDNGNEPLFIVDGVQYNSSPLNAQSVSQFTAGGAASPFSYLNPADIESIQVLKDADATAIYGSRGANGVILITTKKAKDGKLQLDARFYSGISEAPLRLKFMNTEEYLAMRHQAFENDKKKPGTPDHDLNGNWDTTRYTNWQEYFIGGTAPANDASISATMGNSSTAFRIGAGYRSEGTIYPGDFNSKRAGVNFSANHSALSNKFNFSFSGSYNYSQNNLPVNDLEQYITLAPMAPNPYNADGTLNWANSTWTNPMAPFNRSAFETAKNLISNMTVSYTILPSLKFSTSFGYTLTNFKQRNLTPYSSYNPASTVIPPSTRRNHAVMNNDIRTFVIEPQLSYAKSVWDGELDVLVGSTLQGSSGEFLNYSAWGFASDAIIKNLQAATSFSGYTRSITEYKYNALYARAGYSYKRRYVLNLTGRRDASSRFGPGNKAGNFGAIGAAWVFSNENFLKSDSKILSLGKIRMSYGSTGNDQLGEYKYLDTYSIYPLTYQGNTSFTPTQLTNPFYGWERVNKLEFGLELGFIEGRFNLNTSYYRNRTNNQLVQIPLPYTTGFQYVRANLPATIENTGFEVEFRSVNIERKNLTWTTSFNITVPRNKLVSFPDIESSSYNTRFVVGQPINRLAFAYQYTGIDPNTGLFMFKDQNGDGGLTSPQDYIPTFIGQDFYGGLYNSLRFGNLELDFQIQFTRQNGYGYLYTGNAGSFGGTRGNQLSNIADLEHQPFSASNAPVFINGALFGASTGMLTDASFVRLKNAGIYYNLPVLRKAINRSRIFLQGQNLLTISDYIGFDPESPSSGIVVPPLRTVVAGIQLTL